MTMTTTESDKPKRGKKKQAAASPPKPAKPRRWKEQLPVKLSKDERRERGERAAAIMAEIETLEADKKAAAASLKGQIDAKKSELRELGRAVRTGEEYRDTELFEEFEYRTGFCSVKRADTGVELRRRPLTGDERQEKLPLDKKPGDRGGKPSEE